MIDFALQRGRGGSRWPRPAAGALLLALLMVFTTACASASTAGAGPGSESGETSFRASPDQNLLYVCVQDEAQIAVIDMDTREVVHTIDLMELGYSERAQPHHVVVEPDGSAFYVSLIGADRVVKFDADHQVVGEVEMETPGMLSLHPSGDLLLVSRSMSAVSPPQRIGLITRSTMEVEELDIFFNQPHAMVVGRSGEFAYTASLSVNQLASVNLASERVELVDIDGPNHAMVQFAVSPDGSLMAGSGEMSGQLLLFDLSENPAEPSLVNSVEVGHMAFDPVFSPDGSRIWVPVRHTDEVVVVDTESGEILQRISGDGIDAPHQVLFSPDGSTAFISNNNKNPHAMHGPVEDDGGDGAVVVVDVESGEIQRVLRLGRNVTGIGTRNAP
ncbi:MAG: YncE family protein [Gemmatimonadales bacterium]|nr:MAG: YncE family protein [Gemmatimonadales bacterium]